MSPKPLSVVINALNGFSSDSTVKAVGKCKGGGACKIAPRNNVGLLLNKIACPKDCAELDKIKIRFRSTLGNCGGDLVIYSARFPMCHAQLPRAFGVQPWSIITNHPPALATAS